jgi:hypothetical protein
MPLVELLDERGILAKQDALDRLEQLKAEMSARQKLQRCPRVLSPRVVDSWVARKS